MDRPTLYPLAQGLAEHERLGAFVSALPATSARVSEPALPLVLAAAQLRLGRALFVILPDDEDARDAAEAAAWYRGAEAVAFMPGRGVTGSGPRLPAHLVGEPPCGGDRAWGPRVRLGGRGRHAMCRNDDAPKPVAVEVGDARGHEELVTSLVLAGYERVEQVEERGHIAVRGGILDFYPTTGREPLRVELYGDEVEAMRMFSPFDATGAQRSAARGRLSGGRARGRSRRLAGVRRGRCRRLRAAGWRSAAGCPPTSSGSRTTWPMCGREELGWTFPLAARQLDRSSRTNSRSSSRLNGRRSRRGLAEAERELSDSLTRSGLRVVVAFRIR
jgi:hypothetical protein